MRLGAPRDLAADRPRADDQHGLPGKLRIVEGVLGDPVARDLRAQQRAETPVEMQHHRQDMLGDVR
jgi:hypothetical protein